MAVNLTPPGESDADIEVRAARDPIRMMLAQRVARQDMSNVNDTNEGKGTTDTTTDATVPPAHRLAVAALRVALSGVIKDPDSIIETLDLDKFVRDGEPDTENIKRLRGRMTLMTRSGRTPDFGQGDRGGPGTDHPNYNEQLRQAFRDSQGSWYANGGARGPRDRVNRF
jgi:hypothetical protein